MTDTIVEVIIRQPIAPIEINSYVGIPAGGLVNQILKKNSSLNYDFAWIDGNSSTGQVDWASLTNLPTSFPPTAHTHFTSSITGLDTELALKINSSDIATVGLTGSYSDLTGKPTLGTASTLNVPVGTTAASGEVVKGDDVRLSDSRSPLAHSHGISGVTGLQTALDSKQNVLGFTPYDAANPNGYTANSTDAFLLARGNHTGTQLSSTISDFNSASDSRVVAGITGKQATLVSGTNIKTVGGVSILGSGDIVVGGTGTVTNLSFTNSAGFTGTIATATTTPVLSLTLQNANTTQSGQLISTDWNTFNSKESPLIFSTGLTRLTNTITINSTQNISALSNLTSNGLVKTSGSTGTLSTAASGTDYLAPFTSQTANTVYAAPSGSAGVPTFRTITTLDIPTLNQNTTGSAATLTTPRNIQGVAFDGSLNINPISGTGFVKATGTTLSYDNSTYLTTTGNASAVTGLTVSQVSGAEQTANKDATGGYAGLTLFKINFKNAANTFTSFFANANTAARTYTFQNRDGTIADNTDLATKQNAQAGNSITYWTPTTATAGLWIGTVGSGAGTYGTGTPSATASIYETSRRTKWANVVTTLNQVLGQRNTELIWHIGNAAGRGGFTFSARFGFEVWTNGGRMFAGLSSTTNNVVTGNPSANDSTVGFCIDDTDAGLIYFMSRNTTATTKTSTGLTASSLVGYDCSFVCLPNATSITWSISQLGSGTTTTGTHSTNLPANTILMTAGVLASNAALTPVTSINIGVSKIYIESVI